MIASLRQVIGTEALEDLCPRPATQRYQQCILTLWKIAAADVRIMIAVPETGAGRCLVCSAHHSTVQRLTMQ
jgi:hypothetical protein